MNQMKFREEQAKFDEYDRLEDLRMQNKRNQIVKARAATYRMKMHQQGYDVDEDKVQRYEEAQRALIEKQYGRRRRTEPRPPPQPTTSAATEGTPYQPAYQPYQAHKL